MPSLPHWVLVLIKLKIYWRVGWENDISTVNHFYKSRMCSKERVGTAKAEHNRSRWPSLGKSRKASRGK